MKIVKIIFVFLFVFQFSFAVELVQNDSKKNLEIANLVSKIEAINENLKSNMWIKRYNNYLAY